MLQNVSVKFPMSEEELRDLHKEAKQNAMDLFRSKAVGADIPKLIERLKSIILEKFTNLEAENQAESDKKCNAFLINAYGTIEQKLRNNEYKTFVDFEREMKKLQRFFLERGPEGPFRNKILLEFCQKKIVDTADYFIKESQNELDYVTSIHTEKIKSLENDIKDSKDEYIKERGDWQRKLTTAESEKTELAAKENSLREQLISLKSEKDRIESELRASIKTIRVELGQQVDTANTKS